MMPPRQAFAGGMLLLAACGGTEGRTDGDDSAGVSSATAIQQPAPVATDSELPGADTQATGSGTPPAPRSTGGAVSLPAAPLSAQDTARGVVRILGTAADFRVVVHTPTGPVAVTGVHAPAVAALQEMDVWVQGPLSVALGRAIPPRQIEAQRFAVRAVNGVAALDGTLREDSGVLVLVSAAGERTRLISPPPALRSQVGKRVWVTRDGSGAVSAFGVIE